MAIRSGIEMLVAGATLLAGTSLLASVAGPADSVEEADHSSIVRYGRDIRPLLSDRCFSCHGTDPESRAADLRLDSHLEATRDLGDGYRAIVPGDPEASMLLDRISSGDPHEQMPPPEANKPLLSTEEIEAIRAWIASGAEYEPHWAFQKPEESNPPPTGEDWSRNEIDRYVHQRIVDAGIRPNPEADRSTLARRAFLDLTGLPPSPEEIARFESDDRPDAWERLLDRLMTDEPYRSRYAERMATPWLDLARYADTAGIHMDAGKQMWPYRDWVLRAFRDNMPFDRFTIDQLAGDLVENPTTDQLVASGFHRNHVTSDEGGAIAEEYLLEYAVDRVETTGAVWLGLTVGCARCHDHKFDPITQADFYGLIAFFNNVEQPGIYSQIPDANRAFEPAVEIPRPESKLRIATLDEEIAGIERDRSTPSEEERRALTSYLDDLRGEAGLAWHRPEVVEAISEAGATMDILDDGSILATGENPDDDHHVVTLRLGEGEFDALLMEAIPHESLPAGGIGRAGNGNAILSGITLEAVSSTDPSQRREVSLGWAWADHEQPNSDFRITNVLRPEDGRVWAAQSHEIPGRRTLILLANQPFGYPGGTDLVVRSSYRSPYAQHVIGRTRMQVARSSKALRAVLPIAASNWYITGPFPIKDGAEGYDRDFGPDSITEIDLLAKFGARDDGSGGDTWRYAPGVVDGTSVTLAQGLGAEFIAREIWSPDHRALPISIGSDDGVQVYVNGRLVLEDRTDRGVAPDQNRAVLELRPGLNTLVYKVVNTGAVAGMYFRADPPQTELPSQAVATLLPSDTVRSTIATAGEESLRAKISPRYRELGEEVENLRDERGRLLAGVPKTSVMKERAMPRPTYVMNRGQYDDPDESRPVERAVPVVLGSLPDDVQDANRLDLAEWIVGPDNPLTSRVIVNRFWHQLFGRGLVESVEDFGYQSAWPSHPELLDHLAIEFREGGWDVQDLLGRIMSSATYRQSARIRPEVAAVDPGNELLARFPRQRLEAEQIRDQALYAAGLLVESFGGPSVKPYQPEGLWQEVAMLQSNTRNYEQGDGEDLHRRSIYTYWKRACPPPSLLAFDAPTREYCNVRRIATNTPLQALVLWNDPQFVEAARMLAARVLRGLPDADDATRLDLLFLLATAGPVPEAAAPAVIRTLEAFRTRYAEDPDSADQLLMVGESPVPAGLESPELAAWSMIANAVLSSDSAIVKD